MRQCAGIDNRGKICRLGWTKHVRGRYVASLVAMALLSNGPTGYLAAAKRV